MPAMDDFVARANLENFRRKLAEETDHTKRDMLARLLAEEEARLTAIEEDPEERKEA
jgi:hypothetical protein